MNTLGSWRFGVFCTPRFVDNKAHRRFTQSNGPGTWCFDLPDRLNWQKNLPVRHREGKERGLSWQNGAGEVKTFSYVFPSGIFLRALMFVVDIVRWSSAYSVVRPSIRTILLFSKSLCSLSMFVLLLVLFCPSKREESYVLVVVPTRTLRPRIVVFFFMWFVSDRLGRTFVTRSGDAVIAFFSFFVRSFVFLICALVQFGGNFGWVVR